MLAKSNYMIKIDFLFVFCFSVVVLCYIYYQKI
jgi:hypothetical protein